MKDYRKGWNERYPVKIGLTRKAGDYLAELSGVVGVSRRELVELAVWKLTADVAAETLEAKSEKLREVADAGA